MSKSIKQVLKEIDNHTKIIAAHRDKLREIYSELESVIDSLDTGIESMEIGRQLIDSSIDDMSQYI